MKATTAQKAIVKKMTALIDDLERPWTVYDLERLRHLLSKVKSDSLWGAAISQVFESKPPDAYRLNKLIEQLASQAIDDFVTMVEIVGITATLLLLRYYDTKNPK